MPEGFEPSTAVHEDWSDRPLRGRDVLFSRVMGPLSLRNAVVDGHADQVIDAQLLSNALDLRSSYSEVESIDIKIINIAEIGY